MKKAITIIASIAVVCLWVFVTVTDFYDKEAVSGNEAELLTHYIDVGNGDCTFIELPNDKTLLIDAGERNDEKTIEKYIRRLGYNSIDYMVLTHPHSDHMGSAEHIIRQFEIGKIYMPGAVHDSDMFEDVIDAIYDKGYKITEARAGVSILSEDNLEIDIISPAKSDYESLNDYSAVVKLDYNDTSFIFMGDAEALAENEILDGGFDVAADVIKIGHHGSSTSSTEKFIKAVSPKIAVISLGEDNPYGHPHRETRELLKKLNISVYRTDKAGDIIVLSDGDKVYVK